MRVNDGIVVANVTCYIFLYYIVVYVSYCVEEVLQFLVVVDFLSAIGTNTNIRFCEDWIASLTSKPLYWMETFACLNLASSTDAALSVVFLHLRLLLDGAYPIAFDTR